MNHDEAVGRRFEPWKVLETRLVYAAMPWIELTVQRIRLPDGRVVDDYHQIRLPEYCVVYAETPDGQILAARQYRHGVGGVCVVLPAGLMEEGEEPLATMKRELLEETGYRAEDWRRLGSYVPNSNYGCGKAHLFAARNAEKVQEPCSGDLEESEVILLSPRDLFSAVLEGKVASLSMAAAVSLATNPNFNPGTAIE